MIGINGRDASVVAVGLPRGRPEQVPLSDGHAAFKRREEAEAD